MFVLVLRKHRAVLWFFLCPEMSSAFLFDFFFEEKENREQGRLLSFYFKTEKWFRFFFFANHPTILL